MEIERAAARHLRQQHPREQLRHRASLEEGAIGHRAPGFDVRHAIPSGVDEASVLDDRDLSARGVGAHHLTVHDRIDRVGPGWSARLLRARVDGGEGEGENRGC